MSNSSFPKWIVPTVIFSVLGVLIMMVFMAAIGIKNQAVDLRTQFDAQTQSNKVVYDEVTKVIFQKAKVSSKYAEDFGKVYKDLMSARYEGKDNVMMNWITEHNPEFDASLYKEINRSIEAQRAKFTRVQNKLIDIKREHDRLRLRFPSSIMMSLFGEKELELKIVTSSRVNASFDTGVDDNTDPFKF